jgi:hypothetical protein
MKINILLITVATFGLLASNAAQVIEKTAIEYNSRINWSSPLYNKSDGFVVYDRHSVNGFDIVSRWSKKGIKLNVTKKIIQQSSYPPETREPLCVDRNPDRSKNTCPDFSFLHPSNDSSNVITDTSYFKNYPVSYLIISINNRSYRYEKGSVSPQLAQALANTPTDKNVRIKLFVAGEPALDSEVGTSTVKTWRQIFRQ